MTPTHLIKISLAAAGLLLAANPVLFGIPAHAADRAHTLNIYAWAEYFPPALLAKFEAQSGIHVNYTVLDSPETAETILSVGSSNYDLVTMNAAPELIRCITSNPARRAKQANKTD